MPSKTQRSGCPKRVDHSGAVLENGDVDGYAVWKHIVKAAEEHLSKERPDGATLQ